MYMCNAVDDDGEEDDDDDDDDEDNGVDPYADQDDGKLDDGLYKFVIFSVIY
jgi:hypothetical protein